MSSLASPLCPVVLYTPPPGDHHVAHPMVTLPAGQTAPFTLLKGPLNPNAYSIGVFNEMQPGNGVQSACIYVSAFSSSAEHPIWTGTVTVAPQQQSQVIFLADQIVGATSIWVGAWWDNGTYAITQQGVIAYFTAHPNGGLHHTVGIIPG